MVILVLLSLILSFRVVSFVLGVVPYVDGEKIAFQATISESPKQSSGGQRVSLVLPNSQRISVLFALFPQISYGDKVALTGNLKYFKSDKGVNIAYMNYPEFTILEKSENNLLNRLRDKLINFFDRTMGRTEGALMLGIVFGIKEEMPKDFFASLQAVGLLHVIAASGMNITLLAGFLVGFFGLFAKRQYALVLSIFGIFFYALLSGFSPSIVRAAIMGILVFGAQIIGRQSSAFFGLFIAAFIMLFVSPSLIYDIGFQLSFMATFGLIYLRPVLVGSGKVKKIVERSVVGEDFLTTFTAQLATLPILLTNFGTYGISSILVNTLVLWTVPPLMILGGLGAIAGIIFMPMGALISYLCLPLLFYFEAVVKMFGETNGVIKIDSFPISITAGYYLLILAFVQLRIRHREEVL